ncbi:hypothetical protein GALMADRAFT_156339 [Galerina marginata CBS 339.88]|uniref:G-protein coupled receptors family 1 profile domain-containing protein n=1 Tax=Galerina marginata (strain CBS 339.88) TaxID=685588 RepID=A0A067TB55_GALM3|nr:hypothetical protein GALMADRAFT_156339 [Galerina marginata CBS 339.88]
MVNPLWAEGSSRSIGLREAGTPSVDNNVPPPNVPFIVAFDIIYAIGLVSLGAILLTAWRSSQIKRASTWIMVIVSWFITSLANLILVGQQTGRPPMTGVCLTQAMLIYALPIFCSFYATAFMWQVYLSISLALRSGSTVSRTQMALLHAVPCASFLGILIEVLVFGVLRPDTIQRHPLGMYCHLTISTPSKITAGLTILALIVFFSLEVSIAITLWRLWKSSGKLSPLRTQDHISIDVAARVVIFGFCPMVAIGVSALQYIPKFTINDTKTSLIQAALPVVASLIFGTQRDILRVWMFWRRRSPILPSNKV